MPGPPTLGPSIRRKLVANGLPVTECVTFASPTNPAGAARRRRVPFQERSDIGGRNHAREVASWRSDAAALVLGEVDGAGRGGDERLHAEWIGDRVGRVGNETAVHAKAETCERDLIAVDDGAGRPAERSLQRKRQVGAEVVASDQRTNARIAGPVKPFTRKVGREHHRRRRGRKLGRNGARIAGREVCKARLKRHAGLVLIVLREAVAGIRWSDRRKPLRLRECLSGIERRKQRGEAER